MLFASHRCKCHKFYNFEAPLKHRQYFSPAILSRRRNFEIVGFLWAKVLFFCLKLNYFEVLSVCIISKLKARDISLFSKKWRHFYLFFSPFSGRNILLFWKWPHNSRIFPHFPPQISASFSISADRIPPPPAYSHIFSIYFSGSKLNSEAWTQLPVRNECSFNERSTSAPFLSYSWKWVIGEKGFRQQISSSHKIFFPVHLPNLTHFSCQNKKWAFSVVGVRLFLRQGVNNRNWCCNKKCRKATRFPPPLLHGILKPAFRFLVRLAVGWGKLCDLHYIISYNHIIPQNLA